jgi:hypothetical protein
LRAPPLAGTAHRAQQFRPDQTPRAERTETSKEGEPAASRFSFRTFVETAS